MSVDLTAAIVRILNPGSLTVGTGFLVTDDGLVATCAHVVRAAGAGRLGNHLNSAADEYYPFGQADGVRLKQADHHPSQRFVMPTTEPILMLTQYGNQCILKTKRILHSLLSCVGIFENICAFGVFGKCP